jgi:rhodanese-like protein
MSNPVTAIPATESDVAAAHLDSSPSFETACCDTQFALQSEEPGFVLLDVRRAERYAAGKVPGAVSARTHLQISSGARRLVPFRPVADRSSSACLCPATATGRTRSKRAGGDQR